MNLKVINVNAAGWIALMYCIVCCFSTAGAQETLPGEGNMSLNSHMPIIDMKGKLWSVDDTISVYYYKGMVLYKLPYQIVSNDKFGNLIEETAYNYMVRERGAEVGFLFDTLNAVNATKVKVDSMLGNRLSPNLKFYSETNDSLVRTIQLSDGKGVEQVYVSKVLINESYNDSTYLYYSESLNNFAFSFSTTFDNLMKRKLYKIRLFYKQRYSEQYKMNLPEREFAFELKALPAIIPDELVRLFERYNSLIPGKK
ncbi:MULTISPECIES: hypothetical protein [Niastella]|uniref:DUF4412 domain-containing protein n=1 Tax=Niastella soli TaxID=2821487 RepID=A0ABS3Z0V8_9BACT|nr:hypothetical protein [Niastella soli]MBO9203793.1 hypothetical protein [Niastella soli]